MVFLDKAKRQFELTLMLTDPERGVPGANGIARADGCAAIGVLASAICSWMRPQSLSGTGPHWSDPLVPDHLPELAPTRFLNQLNIHSGKPLPDVS